jgi:hypothetical protein
MLRGISLNALYCSKECQAKEWPSHQNECKKKTEKPAAECVHLPVELDIYNTTDYVSHLEGLQAPLSQSDSNFLNHIHWQDYLYFLDSINDQINKKYSSIPLASLFVDMDYYNVFLSNATVRLASDFPFELHPGERSNTEALFHRAKTSSTPATVLRMALRDGYAIHQITTLMQAPHIAAASLKAEELCV